MPSTEHDPPPRVRHWPDRSAHRHRKRAHRLFYVAAAAVLVLPWFGYRHVRDAIRGEAPAPPAEAASPTGVVPPATGPAIQVDGEAGAGSGTSASTGHMAAVRSATAAGDARAILTSVDAMNDASRRHLPLVDRGRSVDREAARVAVQQLPGVRAAGWIDRTRLLVVVARNDARDRAAMIDTVCRRLEPVGDTLGVVVSVQGDATGSGRLPRETSQRCGPGAGARIGPASSSGAVARPPATPGIDALRAQADGVDVPADIDPADVDPDDEARNEESMRILEETTPEM